MRLLFLIALLACQVAPSRPAKHGDIKQSASKQKNQNSEQEAPAKPAEGNCIGCSVAQPIEGSAGNKSSEPKESRLYRTYLWATIIGVAGGLIGLRFIWKQVKATKKAAKAAKKSADFIIKSERAWIIAELKLANERPPYFYPCRMPNGSVGQTVKLRIVLHNSGKTPAWVIGTWMRFNVTTHIEPEPDFSLRVEAAVGPEPVAAGCITRGVNDLIFSGFSNNPGSDTLIIAGESEYMDCFGEKHFTRFGYILKADGLFERIAEPAYNRFN